MVMLFVMLFVLFVRVAEAEAMQGQTTVNHKAVAIAAETVAAETVAVMAVTAAMAMAAMAATMRQPWQQ